MSPFKRQAVVILMSLLFGLGVATWWFRVPSESDEILNDSQFDWAEGLNLVVNCDIFTTKGELIRRYQSRQCIFYDDGRMIRASFGELGLYDQEGQEIWKLKVPRHHALNRRRNGHLIFPVSVNAELNGQSVRGDEIWEVNLEGKVLRRQNVMEFLPEVANRLGLSEIPTAEATWLPEAGANRLEVTHVNTVTEIGPNKLGESNPIFAEGNILVNLHEPLGALIILSSDFKRLLWVSRVQRRSHSAFVLPDGRLVVYMNEVDFGRSQPEPQSDLQEIDPVSEKILWSYRELASPHFSATRRGSLQRLDQNRYLFSDETEGADVHVIERETGRRIWSFRYSQSPDRGRMITYARMLPLEKFLLNSSE